jgi:hypothetical protein
MPIRLKKPKRFTIYLVSLEETRYILTSVTSREGGHACSPKEYAMHPELLFALAAEQRRYLAATMPTTLPPARRPLPARRALPPARAGRRARPWALPRFHVTWTRTTLAAVADRQRARSLVIVISATRTR